MSNTTNFLQPGKSLFPLIVGVAGHRDLREEDIEVLADKIKSVLKEIQELNPLAPMILLSPLAEGADRLAAKTALELGAQLIVPLPMPKELYETNFTTPESRLEFEELLGKSSRTFEIPLAEGNTLENIRDNGEHRDKQYTANEIFIARYSQILITLWDGVSNPKTDGTSEIIKYRLEGIPELEGHTQNYLDLLDKGPVYHILTPRSSNPEPDGEHFSIGKIYPDIDGRENSTSAYEKIFARIKIYNNDLRKIAPSLQQEVMRSKSCLMSKETEPILPQSCKSILEYYGIADALAIFFQRRRFASMMGIFYSVVIAFLFLHVYIEFLHTPAVLALYPITLVITFIIFYVAQNFEFQDKHLEYRALAEGLRVMLFWRLADIRLDVSDYYLKKHFTELEWIRGVLRSVYIQNLDTETENSTPQDQLKNNLKTAFKNWVENQSLYFRKSTRRDDKKVQQLERMSDILFWFGVGIAVMTVIFHHRIEEFKLLHSSIVFLMIMVISFAAAIKGYAEKMVLSEQVKQYERMSDLFGRASKKLKELLQFNDLQQARQLSFELGKAALEENGDWVILHRAKPLEVPKGG